MSSSSEDQEIEPYAIGLVSGLVFIARVAFSLYDGERLLQAIELGIGYAVVSVFVVVFLIAMARRAGRE